MSKYIEVDALKERIRKSHGIRSLEYLLPIEKEMVDAIDNAPSIDIVFCKECIFADFDEESKMYRCGLVSFPHWNDDEHFCSYGEREGE